MQTCQECTFWSELGVIDILAQTIDISNSERKDLQNYLNGSLTMAYSSKITKLYDYKDASSWWINKLGSEYTYPYPTKYYTAAPDPWPNEESNNHKQVIVYYSWANDGTRQLKEMNSQGYPGHSEDEKSITFWEYDTWGLN